MFITVHNHKTQDLKDLQKSQHEVWALIRVLTKEIPRMLYFKDDDPFSLEMSFCRSTGFQVL